MGADFLCATVEWRVGRTDEETTQNRDSHLAEIESRIKALDEVYEDAREEFGGDVGIEKVRDVLLESLREVAVAVRNEHREGTVIRIRGEWDVLITGGMSWGDSPTALFDHICRLAVAGVT